MKKIIALLLPVLLLSACNGGRGKEINKEQAKTISGKISEKAPKEANYTMTSNYDGYSEGKKAVTKTLTKINSDGEFELETTSTIGDEKTHTHTWYVLNETYGGVIYTTDGTDTTVISKKTDQFFDLQLSLYKIALMTSTIYIDQATDPMTFFDEDIDEDITFKYYSKNDTNLTVVATQAVDAPTESSVEEYLTNVVYTVEYDKSVLVSFKTESTSNLNHKSTLKLEPEFSSSKVKITLPKDWEDLLNKTDTSENA